MRKIVLIALAVTMSACATGQKPSDFSLKNKWCYEQGGDYILGQEGQSSDTCLIDGVRYTMTVERKPVTVTTPAAQ